MKNAPFHELEQEQKKNRNYGARKGHWQTCLVIVLLFHLFSQDEATLYKGVSVRPLVPAVTCRTLHIRQHVI